MIFNKQFPSSSEFFLQSVQRLMMKREAKKHRHCITFTWHKYKEIEEKEKKGNLWRGKLKHGSDVSFQLKIQCKGCCISLHFQIYIFYICYILSHRMRIDDNSHLDLVHAKMHYHWYSSFPWLWYWCMHFYSKKALHITYSTNPFNYSVSIFFASLSLLKLQISIRKTLTFCMWWIHWTVN